MGGKVLTSIYIITLYGMLDTQCPNWDLNRSLILMEDIQYTVGARIPNAPIRTPFENRTFFCSVFERRSVFEWSVHSSSCRTDHSKTELS